MSDVSWIGIIVATAAAMAIGAAWYSALAKPWMAASGITEEEVKAGENPMIYLIAAISHFVMAYVLSGVIIHSAGDVITISDGLLTALFLWLGFVVTTMVVTHRFQMRPLSLTVIDSGHYLAVMLVQGAILAWFLG